MKIKTPASKTQLRLLNLIGITETPAHYVQAGEWLSRKGFPTDALPLGMKWRDVAKLNDAEYLQKCAEWKSNQQEIANAGSVDMY